MIEVLRPSMGLKVRVVEYSTLDEMAAAAGKAEAPLTFANAYLRQKGALVAARSWLSEQVNEFFPRLVKSYEMEEKDGEKTPKLDDAGNKIVDEWGETEGEHINRFKGACYAEKHVDPAFGKTEESVANGLQTILSQRTFVCDAKAAERSASERTPPKYAVKDADQIWSDLHPVTKQPKGNTLEQRLAKWTATFKAEGIVHEPFDDASLDEKTRKTRLAWAIKAREDAQAAHEYN